MDFDVHGPFPAMPYYPFPTKPSLQDLTVLHGWILMRVYGPESEYYSTRQLQPQC